MTSRYRQLKFALQNRSTYCTYFPKVKAVPKMESFAKFDKEEFLNSLSNSSISPYLNVEKYDVLKPFLNTRRDIRCTYNFVIDEAVAKDVAEKIISETNKGIIMEGNPGLGLITINLINSNVPVLVFDCTPVPEFSLLQLLQKYPNKITHRRHNMNVYPEVVILKAFDYSKKDGLLWTFIGVATSFYFLRSLVLTAIKYELWQYETNVYLILSASVLDELKNGGSRLKYLIQCGFHLLYSIEEIARYPRRAFLPRSQCDNKDMCLVRIKQNPDLFKVIKKEELSDYFVFAGLLGTNRRNFIIPTLEKWLPDCGPHLISKGISMTNQVRELSPKESVTLFKFFKESARYEDFRSCSSHFFKK